MLQVRRSITKLTSVINRNQTSGHSMLQREIKTFYKEEMQGVKEMMQDVKEEQKEFKKTMEKQMEDIKREFQAVKTN